MKTKKIPLRMCLGCNEMKPKKELIRIVKTKEGDISLDKTGKAKGRGAYICNNAECIMKLKKSKRLEKSFSMAIKEELYEQLIKEVQN